MIKYIGKSIELNYENGNSFIIDFINKDKLKWRMLDKENTKNIIGLEYFNWNEVSDDIFLLSWIEESGQTISQVLNFKENYVYVFLTWADSTARGRRAYSTNRGTIKIL